MKRKIATLLTLALSISLLGGCGGSSDVETTNNESDNDSSGILSEVTNTKSNVLSECLSEEKVIGYTVDSVDKSETPSNIYFFNEGKVTIIPGEEFGLTMGDFAKLSDDEIWKKYETVKEAYAETYRAEQNSKIQNKIDSINEDIVYFQDYIDSIENDSLVELQAYLQEATETNNEDAIEEINMEIEGQKEKIEENKNLMQEKQEEIDTLQEFMTNSSYAEPFFDTEFKFVVETDSSGNNVQGEMLVYPTLQYSQAAEVPDKFFASISFALGLTRQEQIYDTSYNCIARTGSGSFMTREVMDIDTLESKNILVDLGESEINALFEEEVMSHFE